MSDDEKHCRINHPMDHEVPGQAYLCQVDETISCGACCGLYNVPDLDRQNLTALLEQRTARFAITPRTTAAIDAFALEAAGVESWQRPFEKFHHCPFLGLIGNGTKRVGCLLHPLAHGNDGVDFRGLSYYGGFACRTFFCTSTRTLEKRYKQIVRLVSNDWFVYGLVITETVLLSACFEHIEEELGFPLNPADLVGKEGACAALKTLLGLKIDWPFRPRTRTTACHYLFNDPEYPKPAIDYANLGVSPSVYDGMLTELVSAFDTATQLQAAETMLQNRIDAAIESLRAVAALA